MRERTKPAATNGGPRNITIRDWSPHFKNTLVGFFTAILPSGMVVDGLMLHQKADERWVSMPASEWTDAGGARQYAPVIGFIDGPTRERFQQAVLAAVDQFLEAQR
jgi:hypothetical protein